MSGVANLLVGCGPHAIHTYLPVLRMPAKEYLLHLRAVVELEGQEANTWAAVGSGFGDVDFVFVPALTHTHKLPASLTTKLDKLIDKHAVTGVIIATEPRAHMQYALWAAHKGLHILLDKPISTYTQVVSSPERSRQLRRDFELLLERRNPERAFTINTERRYRHDFRYVFERIEAVARDYSIPIAAMYLLVVLSAPLNIIEERLDDRGESKTGANSLKFEEQCLNMYDELARLAKRYMPVLTFDTSDPQNTPDAMAQQVKDAMKSLMG